MFWKTATHLCSGHCLCQGSCHISSRTAGLGNAYILSENDVARDIVHRIAVKSLLAQHGINVSRKSGKGKLRKIGDPLFVVVLRNKIHIFKTVGNRRVSNRLGAKLHISGCPLCQYIKKQAFQQVIKSVKSLYFWWSYLISPGLFRYYYLPSGAERICHNRNKFFQKRALWALFKKDTIGQILVAF